MNRTQVIKTPNLLSEIFKYLYSELWTILELFFQKKATYISIILIQYSNYIIEQFY